MRRDEAKAPGQAGGHDPVVGFSPARKGFRNRARAFLSVLTLAFGVLGSTSAQATLTLTVSGASELISINVTFNGTHETFIAAAQTASLNGGASFDAYCVDLLDDNFIPVSYSVSAVTDPTTIASGLPNANKIAFLYNNDASGATTGVLKAGLQLAIWETEYGSALTINTAPDTTTDAGKAVADANTYLQLAGYQSNTTYPLTYYPATSHGPNGNLYQNLIGPGPPGINPFTPTPEPSTLWMAAMGGVFLLTCYRRWRTTAPA